MFIFLSKLLPLLLYPLGLACLCLVGALVLAWKRPRWVAVPVCLALGLLLLGGNGWVAEALVRSLEYQVPPPTALPNADAIVVLGGATRPQVSPRPWVEVMEAGDRVLYGAKLYRDGHAPIVILSGGRIDWQGPGRSEAADMAELMATMGVPPTAMRQEPTSRNTRENAMNVQPILAREGIERFLLVTSALHMPRSRRIFTKLGMQPIPAPTDFLTVTPLDAPPTSWQATVLKALPEAEYLHWTTRALKEYIGLVVYWLRGWL